MLQTDSERKIKKNPRKNGFSKTHPNPTHFKSEPDKKTSECLSDEHSPRSVYCGLLGVAARCAVHV
jgi:hypothetical protein